MNSTLRSRQLNPCDALFWKSRGYMERPCDWKDLLIQMGYYQKEKKASKTKSLRCATMNYTLRSRQLNPCDHLFWKSRGYTERPANWQDLLIEMGYYSNDEDTDEEYDYEENDSEEYDSEEYYSDEEDEDDEYSEVDSEYEEHREDSNRNNPNNDVFWIARGWTGRPHDWKGKQKKYLLHLPEFLARIEN